MFETWTCALQKPYNCQYQYSCVLCTAVRTRMNLGLALVAGEYVKYCRAPRCYWQESSSSVVLSHIGTHYYNIVEIDLFRLHDSYLS